MTTTRGMASLRRLRRRLASEGGSLLVEVLVSASILLTVGAGVVLAYFSQSFADRAEASRAAGEPVIPPDISMAMGMKTENGSWAVGAGHMAFWDHDRWRSAGGLGKADLRLDYFSTSGAPRAYELEAAAIIQQVLRRIGSGSWYAGARYAYATTEARFSSGRPLDVPERALDTVSILAERG